MAQCSNCGAPITLSADAPTICQYCGSSNDPPPREVEVPVPVQVVQNVVEDAAGAPSELRCPHCHKKLVGVVAKGVELDGCAGCGGIWVNNTSARSVLAKPQEIFAELAKRAGDNARNRSVRAKNPGCPVCTAVLDHVKTHGIGLDVCADHGTWFDAFELGQLLYVLTHGAIGEAPPPDVRRVRCVGCHALIPQDHTNVGPHGILCDRCWRSLQDAEFAADEAADRGHDDALLRGVLRGIAGTMPGGY